VFTSAKTIRNAKMFHLMYVVRGTSYHALTACTHTRVHMFSCFDFCLHPWVSALYGKV
jgi:hypothetical protein